MKKSLGIDLGASNIRAAVVSPEGLAGTVASRSLPAGVSPEECAGVVLDAAIEAAGGKPALARMDGAGVASAGRIDKARRKIIYSPNHAWHNVPLARILAGRMGIPVAIENDVNAAALGEFHFGAGRGTRDMAAVFIGTGIGGGFILDGKLYTGSAGVAAEVGHMTFRPGGLLCGCDRRGCHEAYAGGVNIERRYVRALARAGKKKPARVLATDVCRAARRGDAIAGRIWNEAEEALAVLAANVVSALNPSVLVIGGSIGLGAPGLVEAIRKGVARRAVESAAGTVRVCRAETGKNAGVLGASLILSERRRR